LDLLCMATQCLRPLLLARRLECSEVRLQRRLGVNDEIARIGHVHHQVRAQRALLTDHLQLLGEVAMLGEPGELDEPPQRELAPAAATLGPPKRAHEVTRLALQLRLPASEALELRAQRAESIAPLTLQRLRLCLGALERNSQRFHELRDGKLAFLERALRDNLV